MVSIIGMSTRTPTPDEQQLGWTVAHHGVVARSDGKPFGVRVNKEAGNAASCTLLRIGHRHHLRERRFVCRGDETLDAVQDIAAVRLTNGACASVFSPFRTGNR
jgi:hypothetical protein